MNGDGKPDLIAANYNSHSVSVLLGNGNGNFTGQVYAIGIPPSVITQPVSTTVTPGTTVSFSAAASGSPVPTVQWQFSSDGTNWSNISGATAATYSFTTTTVDTVEQYRAVFTNTAGNVTTNAAILTIDTISPSVTSINRTSPAESTTLASSVSFTATFSEPVSGVDPTDFCVATTGTVVSTQAQVTQVSTSVYTVTVSGITGTGTLGVNIADNYSIHDLAGNLLINPNAAPSFADQATFATGSSPFSVKVGDVNADGKPDLIVTNNNSNSVSVLLGNGNGTFQTQTTFATGSSPLSVTVGDVNADGKLDLIVANLLDSSVSVLLGIGNGTFQTQSTFATGSYPGSVTVADVNADGKLDLIVANRMSDSVSVLLWNGNRKFTGEVYTIATPPVVTTQPVSSTVAAGTTASFSAAASGSPAPTVQWQVSSDGTNWSDINGAAATTYSFTTSAGDTGKQYRAVFTNLAGTVNSAAATLTTINRTFSLQTNYTTTVAFAGFNSGQIRLVDFLDTQAVSQPTVYTATINWGDGNTDTNVPVPHTPANGTTIQVTGSHQYAAGGTYHPIITLFSADGALLTTVSGNTANLIVGANISNKFVVTRSSAIKNRTTGLYSQTVTIKNISGVDIVGNIDLLLRDLTSRVTLTNATGSKSNSGNPYFRFSSSGLKAGQSLSQVFLFQMPTTITAFNYKFDEFNS